MVLRVQRVSPDPLVLKGLQVRLALLAQEALQVQPVQPVPRDLLVPSDRKVLRGLPEMPGPLAQEVLRGSRAQPGLRVCPAFPGLPALRGL